MSRNLTNAQHSKLDHIADDSESIKVVGWHPGGGPILRLRENGLDRTAFRWIHPKGHIKPVMGAILEEQCLL